MSERITAANLDEVIKRNEVIEEQMKQSASLIWSKYNPMQINSPIQLALQILRPYGLIQLPIDNRYLSGAIFVRDGKRIPLINTALPRANQYFTVWHEIYHLLFDEVSFDHLIESEILMEERKAEHFAALMLLGNLMPYFEGLKDMEFQAKAFQCMQRIMQAFRGGIKEFGGKKVVKLLDYAPGLDGLPKSDVLKFLLEGNCSIVVRPSGTEPKLKTYISISAENKETAEKIEAEICKSAEEYLK